MVNVYVIDADDDQPLVGASVRVGDVDATTDATGLVVIADVAGPQTILARADGHATAMWIGADGGNVTIPLDRSPPDTSRPPSAQLSGSIAGWDAQPPPPVNYTQVALITYAQDPRIGARGNDIQQPPPIGTRPAASCVRVRGAVVPCAWRLNARAGTIALGLTIVEIDNRGTADPGDDASTVTGFSVTPITVEAGRNQTGVIVGLPSADSTARPTVDLGTPPATLTEVAALVGLELGERGVVRLAGIDPTRIGAVVPSLSIATGARYELLAVAREPGADGTVAQSVALRRGLTDPEALNAGAWLAPPTIVSADRTTVSFTRSQATGPYTLELDNAAIGVEGRRVLTVAILDGSSQVTLPTAFSPLPADPLTLRVTTLATGAALDLRDFSADAVLDGVVGIASDAIAVP